MHHSALRHLWTLPQSGQKKQMRFKVMPFYLKFDDTWTRKAKMAPQKEEKLRHSCCEELGVIS
jgi:hypothetical protein